jgi:hypothetical protein
MILDILTVLFFVLGFALILGIVWERRGDVLHRVNVADELSRIVRDREGDTNSSDEPKVKGK